jgi:hypothetical protein
LGWQSRGFGSHGSGWGAGSHLGSLGWHMEVIADSSFGTKHRNVPPDTWSISCGLSVRMNFSKGVDEGAYRFNSNSNRQVHQSIEKNVTN